MRMISSHQAPSSLYGGLEVQCRRGPGDDLGYLGDFFFLNVDADGAEHIYNSNATTRVRNVLFRTQIRPGPVNLRDSEGRWHAEEGEVDEGPVCLW